MLTVDLPEDLLGRLRKLADETGRTADEYIREAVVRLLEDDEDIREASERLQNPGRRWTLEEIERGLDLGR